tara:strand:- start:181 stop:372 length:192 start_codon:yes stop_codon:yes gene_type:complete
MKQLLSALMSNLPFVQSVEEEEKPKKSKAYGKRIGSEEASDIEKMDKGFNGSTYSINGRDVDF